MPTKSDIVPEADDFELVEAPKKATSAATKNQAIAKCVAAHTAALPANDIPYKKNVERAQLALSHAIEAEKVHTKMACRDQEGLPGCTWKVQHGAGRSCS